MASWSSISCSNNSELVVEDSPFPLWPTCWIPNPDNNSIVIRWGRIALVQIGAWQIARFVMIIKHLHWHSVCDHALEILDEVQQSNQMDLLEDCCDPEKMHSLQSPGGAPQQSNQHNINSQITYWLLPVSDLLDSLIGPGGLLISSPPPICSPNFSFMRGVWEKKRVTKTWMWEIFLQSHTEHPWRCSYILTLLPCMFYGPKAHHQQQEKGNHGANTKIPTTLLPENPICSNNSEATMEFKSEVILFCKSTED